jgi:Domain of unknown function (DUF1996)
MRKFVIPIVIVMSAAAVIAAVALAGMALEHSGPAQRNSPGSFGVACDVSHVAADDPIVMPGMPGMAHLHAFFGNTSTSAASTRDSMLAAGTTCSDPADTAAVWAPVAIVNGEVVVPQREKTYYFRGTKEVETVPADLRAIGGDQHSRAPGTPGVTWDCGIDTPRSTHPYDCTPYAGGSVRVDGVIARVDLPTCWDGSTDTPDHGSNLVDAARGRCPADHPQPIPRISIRIHYGIWDPCNGVTPCGPDDASASNVSMRLSSGPYYTMHADFWNTWQQDALDALVTRCVRGREGCGVITGDG